MRRAPQKCIAGGYLKIAASYLLVLHTLEPLEQSSRDTAVLLQAATVAGEWLVCIYHLLYRPPLTRPL
jgi:hypothetical protein